MILWLVGMMGSGKTSAGRIAASRLEVPFSDTDAVVAGRMGCSIAQMWGTLGESAFRDMEKVAVLNLSQQGGIVSTGGGVVLDRGNREAMTGSGPVVWLDAAPEVLASRLETTADRPGLVATDRPPIEFLSEMLDERRGRYEDISSHRLITDGLSIEKTARAIEEIWRD